MSAYDDDDQYYDYSNYSNSTNSTYFSEPLYDPPIGITILLSLFYGLISLVSVSGNSTVIFIVVTSRRMQSVTNFFIANLALADVIIGLFSIPFRFQAALLQRWNLPDFMCPFCPFFESVSVNASIFTLTAIAVDRYRAIIYPLKSHASKFKTKGIILGIWVVSTILAIPMAVGYRVEYMRDNLVQCLPFNINNTVFIWYMNLLCLVQYFIPVVLISFAYIRMAVVLWGSRTPGTAQIERDRAVTNNKKKVIKMLMVVVLMFSLAWLPLHIYNVLMTVFPNINYYPYINIIWFCSHWLAMSNSCYNPFIYFLCNDKFKKEARVRFGKCFCCRTCQENEPTLMRTGETFYRGRRNKIENNMTTFSDFTPIQDVKRSTGFVPTVSYRNNIIHEEDNSENYVVFNGLQHNERL
ncbi:tachykinin-like peptides receptor 99D [Eurytemora carolleeae]|uniref:tachykinin-like peptides receptor 99D n=1 Tax=Eurytemora carolleeae TaxID=1294199 RepID=UPI000C78E780|nr:tachykinin-like peptides receptor 99D [Eurytemora carolleeae]|eukprot:XP_023342701.1 tachykinin-like peptides receptor 99D [Eurytemora affinis]